MKTALRRLLDLLQSDAEIRRFQELEKHIDQDIVLQQKYKDLLDAQKLMVQHEVKKHPAYEQSQARYESMREEIMNHLLMGEYLDLLEHINNDLILIRDILEEELNKHLD